MQPVMIEAKSRPLAYYDSFSGLVPCRIIRYGTREWTCSRVVDIECTGTRGPYKRGDVVRDVSLTFVVQRKGVYWRRGSARIVRLGWPQHL